MSRQGLLGLLSLIAVGGCASPLTGLQCAEGYSQCGGECVDTDSDLMHCGSCDMACPASGWVCIGGQCGMELPGGGVDFDASVPDAGEVPDATVDGGDGGPTRPLPEPDKPLCDGTTEPGACRCDVGTLKCGNECVDPASDLDHCGGCDQACMDGQFCGLGTCTDNCVAPLQRCGPVCVSLEDNFANCGSCNNGCSTNICREGVCTGATSGRVVLIGHDYGSHNRSMDSLFSAAFLLANEPAPRILGYSEFTNSNTVEDINLLLLDTLGIPPEEIEAAFLPALSLQLAEADILLIYPQGDLRQSELETKVQTAFEGVLPSFIAAGGVVLVFEGAGRNFGTYQLVNVDGLVDVTRRTRLDSSEIDKTPTGYLGFTSGIATPYKGQFQTFGFEGVDLDDSTVLLYDVESNLPVVLNYIFTP